MYRPPASSIYAKPFNLFLSEFSDLLSSLVSTKDDFIITGDLNIHLDNVQESHTQQLNNLLKSCNLIQHISESTHKDKHILDVIISPVMSSLIRSSITILPCTPSDHFPITCQFSVNAPTEKITSVTTSFRVIKKIDIDSFCIDICNSALFSTSCNDVNEYVNLYNHTLQSLLDKHAPIIIKPIRQSKPWYTSDLKKLKTACHRAERKWRKSRSSVWKIVLNLENKTYRSAIYRTKQKYYAALINNASASGQLWKTVNTMLHRSQSSSYPSKPINDLPEEFSSYFSSKICNLRDSICRDSVNSLCAPNVHEHCSSSCPFSLCEFATATEDEITTLILKSPNKQCNLDPLPTSLLKKCVHCLSPVITKIVNLSLSSGIFPEPLKHAIITPILKKPSLDKENLSNYRPISNLSFLSKLLERIVLKRLTNYLHSNNLLNKYQSAYTKFHSTETVLLSVHNAIITAMSKQCLTGLCLLDL